MVLKMISSSVIMQSLQKWKHPQTWSTSFPGPPRISTFGGTYTLFLPCTEWPREYKLPFRAIMSWQNTYRSLLLPYSFYKIVPVLAQQKSSFHRKLFLLALSTQIIVGYHPPESTSNYSWVESRLWPCWGRHLPRALGKTGIWRPRKLSPSGL